MVKEWISSRHSFITYGITQIAVNGRELSGLFFANLWNDLMSVSRMNLTYVEERFTGSCSDSGANYTGILYSLYHNISDWTIIPFAELNCSQTEQFSFGTVFGDNKNTLVHMHPRMNDFYFAKGSDMDIIADIPFEKSARFTNFAAYLTFFALIVSSGIISKSYLRSIKVYIFPYRVDMRTCCNGYILKKIIITGTNILQVVTRQGFNPSSSRVSVRLIWIILMVHSFVSSTIYFSVFKTNLFKPKEVTRLNNLHDLAASKNPPYRARFAYETNTWKLFANSKREPMKSIWTRANETGSALLYYSEERKRIGDFLNRAQNENWAVISSFANNRFFIDAYCLLFDAPSYSDIQLYRSKETFLHSPTGVIFRKEFDDRSKRVITNSVSKMSQHGFNDYYDKNPQGLLRKYPVQLRCYRMLHETAYSVPEEKVENLALVHYTRLIQICLALVVIGAVVLVCEFIPRIKKDMAKRAKSNAKVHPAKRKGKRPGPRGRKVKADERQIVTDR